MTPVPKTPVVLTDHHAVAYWISTRAKFLDDVFERNLVTLGKDPNSCIPYLGSTFELDSRTVPFPDSVPKLSPAEAQAICNEYGGWPPVHVLTTGDLKRAGNLSMIKRGLPAAVPAQSFVEIAENVFVPTPELTLLQIAPFLTKIQLIVLCSLFFSVFCFSAAGSNRFAPRRALCTASSVRELLTSCMEARKAPDGVARLSSALTYALEQTASPAELNCGLRMELPQKMHGYGFAGASHNARVDTSGSFNDTRTHERWCDWLWDLGNGDYVAVEYESDAEHAGDRRRKRDRRRDNELQGVGVKPFSLMSEHMMSVAAMDVVAFQVQKALGSKAIDGGSDARAGREALRVEVAGAIDRFRGLVA